MKVQCGWCGKSMPDKEPLGDDRISHGICPECYKIQMEKMGMYEGQTVGKWVEAINLIDELLAMIKELLAVNPAFRLKNISYKGSSARLQQEAQIAAEDKAKALIARIEKENQS